MGRGCGATGQWLHARSCAHPVSCMDHMAARRSCLFFYERPAYMTLCSCPMYSSRQGTWDGILTQSASVRQQISLCSNFKQRDHKER